MYELSNMYLCYRFEALRLKKGWMLLAKPWLKTKMKMLQSTAESRKQRWRAGTGQSRGWKICRSTKRCCSVVTLYWTLKRCVCGQNSKKNAIATLEWKCVFLYWLLKYSKQERAARSFYLNLLAWYTEMREAVQYQNRFYQMLPIAQKVAKFIARPLATAALWVRNRIQTSLTTKWVT